MGQSRRQFCCLKAGATFLMVLLFGGSGVVSQGFATCLAMVKLFSNVLA